MPYRKEVFRAPGVIEVKKYHTWRLGGKKTRRKNENTTEPAVQKNNAKRAREKLYRLILTNFRRDDYRIDLTYADPEPGPEEAVKRMRKFLRKLRGMYKEAGKELKYIYVTEHIGHRIHHHLLVNAVPGIGRGEIAEIWPYARMTYRSFRLFDGAPEDCMRLADYLIKETSQAIREEGAVQKLRWVASRNLKRPDVRKETIYSRKWTKTPKPPRGYQTADVEEGYTTDGYPYQFCRFYEMDKIRCHWEPAAAEKPKKKTGRKRKSARDGPGGKV